MKSGIMTDIHTHIIYDVDDGAKTLAESIEMLQLEKELGISSVVLTPHFHHDRNYYTKESLLKKIKELQQYTDLDLYLGNECFYTSKLVSDLISGDALTIDNTEYVLVEFDYYATPEEIYHGCKDIVSAGYKIILAHIERYKHFNGTLAKKLIRLGALFQINASYYNSGINRLHKKLIKTKAIKFIASDAHNTTNRKPDINIPSIKNLGLWDIEDLKERPLVK